MKTHVTVATFEKRDDAEAALAFLKEKGIEAVIEDETGTEATFMRVEPKAALKLRVDAGVVGDVERTIKEWGAVEHGVLQCPECGKSRIEYPQLSRHFPMPLMIYAVLCKLGIFEPEFYCNDCHHTWSPAPPAAEPAVDGLNWPER
jgi:hypothetical protein